MPRAWVWWCIERTQMYKLPFVTYAILHRAGSNYHIQQIFFPSLVCVAHLAVQQQNKQQHIKRREKKKKKKWREIEQRSAKRVPGRLKPETRLSGIQTGHTHLHGARHTSAPLSRIRLVCVRNNRNNTQIRHSSKQHSNKFLAGNYYASPVFFRLSL